MIKRFVVKIIRLYQALLSPDKSIFRAFALSSGHCAMYPTCSEYTILSVEKFGAFRGIFKGIRRILRCHPWQRKLVDLP
jgi:putative membrane protein insertion efficiency factor